MKRKTCVAVLAMCLILAAGCENNGSGNADRTKTEDTKTDTTQDTDMNKSSQDSDTRLVSVDDIDKYINSLSKFYNISPVTIEKDKLNLGELDNNNNILQIIPNKKNHKFDKDKYTLLLING